MDQGGEPLSGDVDTTVPSVARMYDYFLGGKANYPVDHEAAEKLLKVVPSTQILAINNRRFLRRVVRVLAEDYGIRQFVDHGSGLPTQDNVHQVAQRVDARSRVVYVDNDPIVQAYGRTLLEENENTAVLRADLRDTDAVLCSPEARRLLDLGRPLGVLFVSVLHCIPDSDDPAGLIRRIAERVAPGSVFVICQLVSEDRTTRDFVTDFMNAGTHGNWGRVRQEHDVRAYFDGLEIQEPGLVEVSTWRPDADRAPKQLTREWIEWGGIAVKPRGSA
ncbi:SAM-dependent methyltransferase [Streptomyces sp. NPDC048639]|uniref:SAM-dependent methyltransferase n=1 Tax=Streptomyces sp. NPDC048639 TaxID=3365581 RepID=UPI003721F5D8